MNEKLSYKKLDKRLKELEKEIEIYKQKENEWVSEAKFRDILNHIESIPVQGYNSERYVVYWNTASEKVYGYSKDEAVGRKLEDLIIPDKMRGKVIKYIERWVNDGEPIPSGEFILRNKRGDPVHVYSSHAMHQGDNGNKEMFCIDIDLSQLRHTENALQQNERRYASLVNNLSLGVYRKAIDSEDRFIEANPAILEIFGFDSKEDFLKAKSSEFYCNHSELDSFVAKLISQGTLKNEQLHLLKKDGTRLNASVSAVTVKGDEGEIKYIDGIIEDITKQKQTEDALRESEKTYRMIFKSASDPLFLVDVETLLILDANEKAIELWGYSYEELLRLKVADLSCEPEKSYKAIQDDNDKLVPIRYSRKKDGTVFPIEITANYISIKGKTVNLSSIRDISERIVAENEKERLQAQLQQAHKMQAIGTLAGGIAHNFNNILMGIQGRASLIMADKKPSHPDAEQIKGIEEYVRRAAGLTKDLLGFARSGKYQTKPTDLNALIKQETRMFGRTRKEIQVRGKYEKKLWVVEVDPGQIQQALLNLYINAWQAMPAGGELDIRTENVILDSGHVKSHKITPGKYVKISVTDTGPGMDETIRQQIFDPFFSTKDTGQGSGLGLASVYGIVQNHGGFINVYSEKGEGTTFNIYLPASEKEFVEKAMDPEPDCLAVQRGQETVLLVDDEDIIIDVGQRMLERLGYRVLIAQSGKEALDVFEKQMDEIDLVILDLVMPGMGGGKVYDRMKDIDDDVKVLLSSGYSINGQAKKIMDRGCREFIQKPFSLNELSTKIKEALGKTKE